MFKVTFLLFSFFFAQVLIASVNLPENTLFTVDEVESRAMSKHVVILKRAMPNFHLRLKELQDEGYTCVGAPLQVMKCHQFEFNEILPKDIYQKIFSKWQKTEIAFDKILRRSLISQAPALEHWEVKQDVILNEKKYKSYSLFIQADGNMKINFAPDLEINLTLDQKLTMREIFSTPVGSTEYKTYFVNILFK
jgi:hypothetical protein